MATDFERWLAELKRLTTCERCGGHSTTGFRGHPLCDGCYPRGLRFWWAMLTWKHMKGPYGPR